MAQLPEPAAAAAKVAALEEATAGWQYELDLDDSDIRVDSLPLSHSSLTTASHPRQDKPPHHHRHIPGPAAAVQETIRLLSDTRPPRSLGRWDAHATDADFLLPPWLRALQYLGKDRVWEQPGIRAIKDNEELPRARLVAGVVTACKPNGLGDLFLTVKDPTDSIGASVHKKVLLQDKYEHAISIGCAVVFSKVAVFRPSRKSCYLNVNKGKVIQVFSKDFDAPSKQVISSSTTERSQGDLSNQEDKLLVGDPHRKHTSSYSTDSHPQQNMSIPNIIGCVSTPKETANANRESLLNPKGAGLIASESGWTDEEASKLDFADY